MYRIHFKNVSHYEEDWPLDWNTTGAKETTGHMDVSAALYEDEDRDAEDLYMTVSPAVGYESAKQVNLVLTGLLITGKKNFDVTPADQKDMPKLLADLPKDKNPALKLEQLLGKLETAAKLPINNNQSEIAFPLASGNYLHIVCRLEGENTHYRLTHGQNETTVLFGAKPEKEQEPSITLEVTYTKNQLARVHCKEGISGSFSCEFNADLKPTKTIQDRPATSRSRFKSIHSTATYVGEGSPIWTKTYYSIPPQAKSRDQIAEVCFNSKAHASLPTYAIFDARTEAASKGKQRYTADDIYTVTPIAGGQFEVRHYEGVEELMNTKKNPPKQERFTAQKLSIWTTKSYPKQLKKLQQLPKDAPVQQYIKVKIEISKTGQHILTRTDLDGNAESFTCANGSEKTRFLDATLDTKLAKPSKYSKEELKACTPTLNDSETKSASNFKQTLDIFHDYQNLLKHMTQKQQKELTDKLHPTGTLQADFKGVKALYDKAYLGYETRVHVGRLRELENFHAQLVTRTETTGKSRKLIVKKLEVPQLVERLAMVKRVIAALRDEAALETSPLAGLYEKLKAI